jgi:hypothetical protein
MVGWCSMCRCNGETVDHLLLHCPVARELWSFVFRLFGVDWVIWDVFWTMWLVGGIGLANILRQFGTLCLLV